MSVTNVPFEKAEIRLLGTAIRGSFAGGSSDAGLLNVSDYITLPYYYDKDLREWLSVNVYELEYYLDSLDAIGVMIPSPHDLLSSGFRRPLGPGYITHYSMEYEVGAGPVAASFVITRSDYDTFTSTPVATILIPDKALGNINGFAGKIKPALRVDHYDGLAVQIFGTHGPDLPLLKLFFQFAEQVENRSLK